MLFNLIYSFIHCFIIYLLIRSLWGKSLPGDFPLFTLLVFHVPHRLVTGDGDQGNIVARQGLAEHLLAQTFPPHRVRLEVFEVLQQVAVLVGVAVRQVAGKVQYKERERKKGKENLLCSEDRGCAN